MCSSDLVPGIDVSQLRISVTRSADRVHALVQVPASTPADEVPMITDWVGRALRQHDRYAKVIDVGVRTVS